MMLKNLDLTPLQTDIVALEALGRITDLQQYAGEDMDVRPVHYNKPQLKAQIVGANEGYHVWGRGTGKSEGLMAEWSARCAHAMPRSRGAFVARTYLQLLERTLPPVIAGWERMGYRRGIDFWVREKPPKSANIPTPIVGPCVSDHTVFWKNGSVISMVSQDRPGSANSMTIHYEGGDEAKFLDKGKLDTEIAPANRGGVKDFGDVAEFHSILYCTDMPTDPAAQWILDKQKQMDENKIELIMAIQLEIFNLTEKLLTTLPNRRGALLSEIQRRKKQYDQIRATAIHYTEASTLDNIEAFGMKNFLRLKRNLPSFIFSTAILNRRRKGAGLDFYPDLASRHYYDAIEYVHIDRYDIGQARPDDCRKDTDLDHHLPLLVGADYNSSINPIAIGQLHGRGMQIIKDMHVLSPLRLKDLAVKFDKYYTYYKKKHIVMFYDHTGLPTSAATDTPFVDHFLDVLKEKKWQIEPYYIGQTPSPKDRYEDWGIALRGGSYDVPYVTFNRSNTEYVCEAMRQTKTQQGRNGFEKNKGAERGDGDQRQTTHYTDAIDTLLQGAKMYMAEHYGSGGGSMDIITA